MSKKPVPKKQQAKSQSRSRHSKYVAEQRKRLENGVQTVKCSHCGETRRTHYACAECGYYRGRQVLRNFKAPKLGKCWPGSSQLEPKSDQFRGARSIKKLVSRRSLSQFYSLAIRRKSYFMKYRIVVRRILRLQNWELKGSSGFKSSSPHDPTEPLTLFESNVFKLHKVRQSRKFEALKLRNVWPGSALTKQLTSRGKIKCSVSGHVIVWDTEQLFKKRQLWYLFFVAKK